MALSDSAINSLAGLWGSYDFYLIRDRHFKTTSDMVERFLDRYQPRWKKSPETLIRSSRIAPRRCESY